MNFFDTLFQFLWSQNSPDILQTENFAVNLEFQKTAGESLVKYVRKNKQI